MTVPFRDAAESEVGGTAAYLRIVAAGDPSQLNGAVFQIDSRGLPVEFVFSTVRLPSGRLWRAEDLHGEAVRELIKNLFKAVRRTPLVLLYLADELPEQLLRDDLVPDPPVVRVTPPVERADAIGIEWSPRRPGPESPATRLVDSLSARGLVLEPFQRTLAGLAEALAERSD